jgi:hypothetical protein
MEPCSWKSTRVQVSDFEGMSDGFLVNTGLQAKTRTGSSSTSSLVLDNERGELLEATVRIERKRVAAVLRSEFWIHDWHIGKVPSLLRFHIYANPNLHANLSFKTQLEFNAALITK